MHPELSTERATSARVRRWLRAYAIDEADLEDALARGLALWEDMREAEQRWLARADARLARAIASGAPTCEQALRELVLDEVTRRAPTHVLALELLCQYTGQEMWSASIDALGPTPRAALDAALLELDAPWSFEAMLSGEAPGALEAGAEGRCGWSTPEAAERAAAFFDERADEVAELLATMEWEGSLDELDAQAALDALDELVEWAHMCAGQMLGLATFGR